MKKWSGEKRTAAIAFDVEPSDSRIGINLICSSGEHDRLSGFNLVCGNANIVTYLASPLASATTGASMRVDDGLTTRSEIECIRPGFPDVLRPTEDHRRNAQASVASESRRLVCGLKRAILLLDGELAG